MSVTEEVLASENQASNATEPKQLLTFAVGDEEYGIDIMFVREIKGWTSTTRLPNSPNYVCGVVNLRGAIIPIFDLRARFGMDRTQATEKHVVIIIAVGERTIGILVDAVSDILTVEEEEIRTAPTMESNIDNAYVDGLVSIDKRMVVLLNTAHVFNEETLKDV